MPAHRRSARPGTPHPLASHLQTDLDCFAVPWIVDILAAGLLTIFEGMVTNQKIWLSK